MATEGGIILFGVKSPLIVDYEETVWKLRLQLLAAVSVGSAVRLASRDRLTPLADVLGRFEGERFIPCAFAPQNRRDLCNQAGEVGLTLAKALVDPHAVVARSSRIGAGGYLSAGVVIAGATLIDACVVVNRNASVGHHCMLGAFVSIGPGATLASNIVVGQDAVIGAGATVLPGVKIGEGAVVSGGSVVRRDVAAGTVVSGNPAKPSRLKPQKTAVVRNDQE